MIQYNLDTYAQCKWYLVDLTKPSVVDLNLHLRNFLWIGDHFISLKFLHGHMDHTQ